MCLIIKKGDHLKPTEKDIYVFKLLKHDNVRKRYYTPYQHVRVFSVSRGFPMNERRHTLTIQDSPWGYTKCDGIESGVIHCYSHWSDDIRQTIRYYEDDYPISMECFLMKIPKGTEHIMSMDGTQIGTKKLVFCRRLTSLDLWLIEKAYNIKTCFRALFC